MEIDINNNNDNNENKKDNEKSNEEEEEEIREMTEKEIEEKEELMKQGYANWDRKDYNNFIKAMEAYGRNNIDLISRQISNKNKEEIIKYHTTFWSRYKELQGICYIYLFFHFYFSNLFLLLLDWEKVIRNIEKGEMKLQQTEDKKILLEKTIKQYKDPYNELKIQYTTEQQQYKEKEDVILLVLAQQVGYGDWNGLKVALRQSPYCRFNWFMKSRSIDEIKNRIEFILSILQKQSTSPKKRKNKSPKDDEDAKVVALSKRRKNKE